MSPGDIRCMSKRANCRVHFSEAMNSRSAINGLLLIGLLLTQFQGSAQDIPGYTLPDDPGEAWAEVMNLHRELRRRPDHWRAKQPSPEELAEFQQEVRRKANAFVDKGLEFINRFRTSIHISDALLDVLDALGRAAAAGDGDAVGRIQSFVDMVLADQTILEDWRVMAFVAARRAVDMQEVGMRLFCEVAGHGRHQRMFARQAAVVVLARARYHVMHRGHRSGALFPAGKGSKS
jgi:hypothetical protein